MAIAYEQSASAGVIGTGGAGSADAVITHGMSIAEGDLLIAFGMSGSFASWTLSPPAGWVQEFYDNIGGEKHFYIWSKVAGASEPSSYTFAAGGTYQSSRVTLLRVSGASDPASNALEIASTLSTATGGTKTSPAVTPSDADSLILLVCGHANNRSITYTHPTGTTEAIESNSPWSQAIAYFSHGTTSTGTKDWTVSPTWPADGFWMPSVALAPSASGPTYTLTAAAGTFTLTGITTGLAANRQLPAAAGTFTLSGPATGLAATRKLPATAGTFTLAGLDAGLAAARKLAAATGTFTLTGIDAGFTAARRLPCDVRAYTLTGQAVTLDYSGAVAPSFTIGRLHTISRPLKVHTISRPLKVHTISRPPKVHTIQP